MVRFGGTRSKLVIAIVSLVLTCSGCTQKTVDSIRPEVNHGDGLLLSPSFYEAGYTLTTNVGEASRGDGESGTEVPDGGGSNEGSSGGGGGTYNPGVEDTAMPPLASSVVSSADYTTYLQEQIKDPVMDALSDLRLATDAETYNKLYFRIFHVGYNKASINTNKDLMRSAIYSFNGVAGSKVTQIGGDSLRDFVYNYLIKRYGNYQLKEKAVQKFQNSLEGLDFSMSYDAARVDERIPSEIVSMWGSSDNKESCRNLGEFLSRARTYPNRCIPNLTLEALSSTTSSKSVVFNNVNRQSNRLPFQGGISVSAFRSILVQMNQFNYADESVNLSCRDEDANCVLWAYVDNYSTTIVVLGCSPSNTLRSILGSQYNKVSSVIRSTKSWNEVSAIASLLGDNRTPIILESGLRG